MYVTTETQNSLITAFCTETLSITHYFNQYDQMMDQNYK